MWSKVEILLRAYDSLNHVHVKLEISMSKYLFKASYTQSGTEGLLREGGTGRRDALRQTVESMGGTLEAFYYAFGTDDLLIIADLPDDVSAAAMSMRINAAGVLNISATPLLDPEDIDAASEKDVQYRTPRT